MNNDIQTPSPPTLMITSKLIAGWESHHFPCWALGTRATVELLIDGGAISAGLAHTHDLTIGLTFKAYIPTGHPSRTLRIVVNNVPVDTLTILTTETREATVRVPLAIARAGEMQIDLLLDEAASPRAVNESSDQRSLAVHMIAMSYAVVPKNQWLERAIITASKAAAQAAWSPVLHTDAWNNANGLEALIKKCIDSRKPASVIRLGDGEGRILANPYFLNNLDLLHDVIWYQLGRDSLLRVQHEFHLAEPGEAFSYLVTTLKELLRDAISNCDVLGIPTPVHFIDPIPPEQVNGQIGFAAAYVEGRKLASHLASERFYDTFIFRGLSRNGGIRRLLTGLPFVGLVYHSDFTDTLQRTFGIGQMQFTQVPSHSSFAVGDTKPNHFPTAFFQIANKLSVPFKGAVYIVGAGYLGKAYCDVIKRRGGIALDVGSVLDEWSGLGRTDVDARYRLN